MKSSAELKVNPLVSATHKVTNLRLFLALVSFILAAVVASYTFDSAGSRFLFILPTGYGVFVLVLPAIWIYRRGHIGLTILNTVIAARYLVLPLFRALSIDQPIARGITPTEQGVEYGIVFMFIELVTVFLTVQIFAPKFYRETSSRSKLMPIQSSSILLAVLGVGLICWIVLPEVQAQYNFFLNDSPAKTASMSYPLSGLIMLFVDLVFVLVPLLALNYFKRKYDESPHGIYVLLSLLAILPVVTIFKGSSRFSVVLPCVAYLIVLLKLYPKFRKALIISVVSGAIFVFSIFSVQLEQITSVDTRYSKYSVYGISQTLDAYMSGPNNMARVFDVQAQYGASIDTETMKNDVLNNVALLSRFADSSNTTTAWFNEYFYGHRLYADQIIPLSGQSFLHFGVLGMPILIVLTTMIMMRFDNLVSNESRIEYIYVYTILVGYMSMAMMLSFGSIYPLFTNLVLPAVLIFGLNRKFLLRHSNSYDRLDKQKK